MAAQTPIFGFDLPVVNGDDDVWGTLLNINTIGPIDTELGRGGRKLTKVAPSAGGVVTLNLALGVVFDVPAPIAGWSFAFSNVPPEAGFVSAILIRVTNGGAQTYSDSAAIKWPGGVVPSFTVSGIDMVHMVTFDNGTTWHAAMVQKDSQ